MVMLFNNISVISHGGQFYWYGNMSTRHQLSDFFFFMVLLFASDFHWCYNVCRDGDFYMLPFSNWY
jgi:hypothetical protein